MSNELKTPDNTPDEQPERENPNLSVIIIVNDTEEGVIKFVRQPASMIETLGMIEWARTNIKERLKGSKPPEPKIMKPTLQIPRNLGRKH